jgi:hypothetical protein
MNELELCVRDVLTVYSLGYIVDTPQGTRQLERLRQEFWVGDRLEEMLTSPQRKPND